VKQRKTGPRKLYASTINYEAKLRRVGERLGVDDLNWNYDRWGAWVQFRYKGELYRFDHSVENARTRGIDLYYGSDCFAQIVLSLEDLARMVERGIYDLSVWVAGMKMLPPATEVPECFRTLGFTEVPDGPEIVKARYRSLAKALHPDAGGNAADFQRLKEAAEQAVAYFGEGGRG